MKRERGDTSEAMRRKPDQFADTMFAAPTINLNATDSSLRVGPIRGEAPSVRNAASEAAADAIERNPAKRDTQHKKILRALAQRPNTGMTRNELAAETGIKLQSVCARVFEMGKGSPTKAGRGWIDEEETIRRDGGSTLFLNAKGRAALSSKREAA